MLLQPIWSLVFVLPAVFSYELTLPYFNPQSPPPIIQIHIASSSNLVANWSITLHRNDDLIPGNLQINGEDASVYNCFYQGKIQGVPDSGVTFVLCPTKTQGTVTIGHQMYEINRTSMRLIKSAPPKCQHGAANHTSLALTQSTDGLTSLLTKRSVKTRYIKLFLVNDYERVKQAGANLNTNTLQLANVIAQRYKASSFTHSIIITVVGIYNAPGPMFGNGNDAKSILTDFNEWRSGYGAQQSDAALLLSGRDFQFENSYANTGLAYTGTLCSNLATGAVQAIYSEAVATNGVIAAHELGHVMMMDHDGTGKGSNCAPTGFIMSSNTCTNCPQVAQEVFSTCSIKTTDAFLDQDAAKCARIPPSSKSVCGNGKKEAGEQCDSSSQCCVNCQFASAGTTCPNGQCNASGGCESTCGNGRIDIGEECDDSASQTGCCDPTTCRYKTPDSKCSSGSLCKSNQCQTKRGATPVVKISSGTGGNYMVAISVTDGSSILYTLDGSVPFSANRSTSLTYSGPFTINAVDALVANMTAYRQAVPEVWITLKVQSYTTSPIGSPIVSNSLGFATDAADFKAAGERLDKKLGAGAIAGIVIGVLAFLILCAVAYKMYQRKQSAESCPPQSKIAQRYVPSTYFVQRRSSTVYERETVISPHNL